MMLSVIPAAEQTPTRVRYKVVAFAVALAGVTYFDRVCISTLAPDIMRELNLSPRQMSFVFSAFTLAYAAFEVPTAYWGEIYGTRKILTRIVTWWSAFTMLTAMSFNYASLLAIRFLFGAGEAGAWPNAARTFSRWIPASERGRVQGVFFAGAHLAGGITPALVVWMHSFLGWRAVFVVFGIVGLVWAVAWYLWFRDEPKDHPSTNEAEVALITAHRRDEAHHSEGGYRWREIFGNRSIIALCVAYFSNTYGFYFLITWLPAYLEKQRGFSKSSLALFAGLPLLLSVIADLFGGYTTDALTRRLGVRWGRVAVGSVAYAVAGLAMFISTASDDAIVAAVMIAVAAAASMFTLGASWAACIDIGGRRSGVVSAIMNTTGQFGGILSPILLTELVARFANWSLPLHVMGGLYLLSAVSWLFVDPRQHISD